MSETAAAGQTCNNSPDGITIVKFDAPLGAEVRGIDFAEAIPEDTQELLRQAWADNLILLFRGQNHLTQQQHIEATRIFGRPVAGASRSYFERTGTKSINISEHPELIIVSNLGPDGKPVLENEGLGSGEVVWHSDNSYIDQPPIGSFLRAMEVPEETGNTSFNNQYLAYETLPEDVKAKIKGLYTKQDSSRNSAGRLRPGVKKPETLEEVPGPNHPLVRLHPVSGKKALYLGRRRVFPSQYIVGWSREESEKLLDFLWAHATADNLKYTHKWRVGDMVLWDNRCVMHYRDPINSEKRRIMHRTQMEPQTPIMA